MPAPSGVSSVPSIRSARRPPGSSRYRPRPVPISIVPSPGSTLIEPMKGEAPPPSAGRGLGGLRRRLRRRGGRGLLRRRVVATARGERGRGEQGGQQAGGAHRGGGAYPGLACIHRSTPAAQRGIGVAGGTSMARERLLWRADDGPPAPLQRLSDRRGDRARGRAGARRRRRPPARGLAAAAARRAAAVRPLPRRGADRRAPRAPRARRARRRAARWRPAVERALASLLARTSRLERGPPAAAPSSPPPERARRGRAAHVRPHPRRPHQEAAHMRRHIAAAVALAALAAAAPASAHQGSPDFLSEVGAVEPALDGHLGRGPQPRRPPAAAQHGRRGRVDPRLRGRALRPHRRRRDRRGQRELRGLLPQRGPLREGRRPARPERRKPPKWKEISRSGRFEWHDHRAHWMGEGRPPQVTDPDVRTKVFDWTVPLRVGDRPGAIRGR